MGGLSSRLLCRRTPELRVLIFGLDAAGKTSVLYRLKLNEVVTTIPTIGFNVETVEMDDRVRLTMWDLGGRDKIRPLFRHYFPGSHGAVFIIDSCDRERLPEAIAELNQMSEALAIQDLPNLPMAILCNKCDRDATAASETMAEVQKLLADEEKMPSLRERPVSCYAVSAVTGEGLTEAMNWLVGAILKDGSEETQVTKGEIGTKPEGRWEGLYHLVKSAMMR